MKTFDGKEFELDENGVTKEKFYAIMDLSKKPSFGKFKYNKNYLYFQLIENERLSCYKIFSSYKNCLKEMLKISEQTLDYYNKRISKEQEIIKNLKMAIE